MAENKKSFILYTDITHTVTHLTDEQAGKLFKHILSYVNDEDPKTEDIITNLSFEPIKQQLKRDLKKYEERAERSRENGSKGGRPRNPEKPNGLNDNPKEPKKPDNDNVTVNVNDNVNDIKKVSIEERKLKFASTLKPFVLEYGRDLINDFYSYWTEPNKSKTKFRQELEKTWDLNRRLTTWRNNNAKFKTKNDGTKQSNNADDQIRRSVERILGKDTSEPNTNGSTDSEEVSFIDVT